MKYVLTFILSVFSLSAISESMTRDYLLENEIDMNEIDLHNCRRVHEMSYSEISIEECNKKLVQANKECMSIVNEYVPSDPSIDEARGMVRILMTCPVAKILGIEGYDPKKVMGLSTGS